MNYAEEELGIDKVGNNGTEINRFIMYYISILIQLVKREKINVPVKEIDPFSNVPY